MGIIESIQSEFLKEAVNSPILLSDLANMEKYIAESYQERSIIELLQNADDAQANKFLIKDINNSIIVANNGRVFNENDAVSICRSGSSTKKRDGNSIGYRGIGFKAVVNFSKRVHIVAKDIKMTFSKELTNNLIQQEINVPLIRIPHHFTPYDKKLSDIADDLFQTGYKTIFIFEDTNIDSLNTEVNNFDNSSLLFLNSIQEVIFETNELKRIKTHRHINENKYFTEIIENEKQENWLVINDHVNSTFSIAFLLNEKNEIVPLDNERCLSR